MRGVFPRGVEWLFLLKILRGPQNSAPGASFGERMGGIDTEIHEESEHRLRNFRNLRKTSNKQTHL